MNEYSHEWVGLRFLQNESFDAVKKAQLRELATLNGALREEGLAHMSGTASPFNNPGMKRAKTRR